MTSKKKSTNKKRQIRNTNKYRCSKSSKWNENSSAQIIVQTTNNLDSFDNLKHVSDTDIKSLSGDTTPKDASTNCSIISSPYSASESEIGEQTVKQL